MKKTYMAPAIKVQQIKPTSMICISGTLDGTQSISDVNNVGSRGSDFDWEDEEDY